jgi:hypothetical protein
MDKLEAFARAHWQALMVVLGVWIAVATALARKWPKPAATAAWYLKAAHFLFVDLPSLAASLNGKTWMGFTFSIPFVTWTVRDPGSAAGGATILLPLLLLPALLAAGCAGFKAPAYTTMTAMAGATGVAAENLPKICEGQEAAAVDHAATKDEAIQKAGAIHAQCVTAAGVLKTLPDGLQAARDAINGAPSGADLTALMPWVKVVVTEYCDIRPLLLGLGYQLPNPGVC